MASAMPRAHRRLPSGLALALALSALACTPGARPATATTPGRGTPPTPPTFTVPASARVHGGPTTIPASTAPNVTTTPASTATGTTSAGVTGPAGGPAATAPGVVHGTTGPTGLAGVQSTTGPTGPTGLAGVHTAQPPKTASHLSTGAIVASALAVLLIVLCLLWGAARWSAYEPRWTVSLRHSLAEASWRLSASWDEFSDWAKLGR
jgi:hypothetical protein